MGQEIALILPPVDLKHQHKPRVFMQPSFWLFDNWTEILPFRIYQLLLFVCMIVGSIQKLFSIFKLESAFCKLICNFASLFCRVDNLLLQILTKFAFPCNVSHLIFVRNILNNFLDCKKIVSYWTQKMGKYQINVVTILSIFCWHLGLCGFRLLDPCARSAYVYIGFNAFYPKSEDQTDRQTDRQPPTSQ